MKWTQLAPLGLFATLAWTACGDNSELDEMPAEVEDGATTDESAVTDDHAETDDSSEELETQAILDVKDYVEAELEKLNDAAVAIQDAAPEPDADGWNAAADAAAVQDMRSAWRLARASYERVEGAIAVLFPNYDAATDERYDGFIEEQSDDNLFDGEGVTGVHGIERILWADEHPASAVSFESALPGYVEASYPANETEADDFKNSLVQRLVDDTRAMVEQFEPLALDAPSAFRGVIGSMEEQIEKVDLAATGEDESRYAQHTLGDMRANLEGGRAIFDAFVPWLEAQQGGEELVDEITSAFEGLAEHYEGIEGDAVPEVPADWNPDQPNDDSAYGELVIMLQAHTDPDADDSLVALMIEAADTLGIAELPE